MPRSQQMDVLVTRRMTLRPPLQVDAESITAALSNLNVVSNLARVPYPYGLKDAEEWIDSVAGKPCLFTMHREQLMGCIGVENGPEMPTLGFWLAEPFWGKGYMTEAVRAVLAYAFRHYKTDLIGAQALSSNTSSLRVMEKLGFEHRGTGTVFIQSKGEGYPATRTQLTRESFEARFGVLDSDRAA